MVMSLFIGFWESLSLSAGCNLFASKFRLCVYNVQRAHSNSPAMFTGRDDEPLVPLDTFLATALPKTLLAGLILGINACAGVSIFRRSLLFPTTRALLCSLFCAYGATGALALYSEISLGLFLLGGVRITHEQGRECLIVNTCLLGLTLVVSSQALSLAIDRSLSESYKYKPRADGVQALWVTAIWIPPLIVAALPIIGWRTEFKFCIFLLQFKREYLRFVGGANIVALIATPILQIFFFFTLRQTKKGFYREDRRVRRKETKTLILLLSLNTLCSVPFHISLLLLNQSEFIMDCLFILLLVPHLLVPLILLIQKPDGGIVSGQTRNPLASTSPLFFLQSKEGPTQFFSTHYLPSTNEKEPTYESLDSISSDAKYGFPLNQKASQDNR